MFIIEKPLKTIIRREGKHLFFSLLFFSIIALPVLAQIPSFEIAPHPEPDITNVTVSKTDSSVIITAEIFDVSGVSSAGAIIKNPDGSEKTRLILYDNGSYPDEVAGDNIYGALILIDSYPLDTFTVDFFATDVFGNRADLSNAGSFITGGTLLGYSYRKKITIQNDQIESNLENFPLLVSIPSAIADKMIDKTNWNDIRFTGSDGLTPLLYYEKESMSASGGKYWVKVPNLYTSPTGRQNQIYVYYGKAGNTGDLENVPANVWDSSFKGVWHLGDTGPTTAYDSTSNPNDGTQSGGVTFGVAGKVGKATNYDGSNDFLNINNSNAEMNLSG